jgi:RNA polymerase sigma-70 factor (ECF subfamily)
MTDNSQTQILVEKAQAGDRSALEDLMQQYRERLQAGIEMQLPPRQRGPIEPDEILQETLVQALQSLGRFHWQGEDSFYHWLCGIAKNVILKTRKKTLKSRTLQLPERVPGSNTPPSKSMRRDERFDRLEKALSQLSAEHREVIRLHRLEGLKVSEVAERMNRSENAVRLLLARAAMKMRKSFGDTESLHLPDRTLKTERDTHGEG